MRRHQKSADVNGWSGAQAVMLVKMSLNWRNSKRQLGGMREVELGSRRKSRFMHDSLLEIEKL